jgi:hypothetical protein
MSPARVIELGRRTRRWTMSTHVSQTGSLLKLAHYGALSLRGVPVVPC